MTVATAPVRGAATKLTPAELNDYGIENRRCEVAIRQKQSQFRRSVLQNFESHCCLSGIAEESLLVASHVVPWAMDMKYRLDPANGVLLYYHYDQIFDQGFITFSDDLRVIASPLVESCSPPLRSILDQLAGQQARKPVNYQIKAEYLAYHRAEVFRSRSR